MTEEESRLLAERIVATWPGSAKHFVWKQVIADLDHHAADVTYRILRDGATTTPTTGAFKAAYRNQLARLTEPAKLFDVEAAPPLSRDEYLARLAAGPIHGDTLEHWSRTIERRHLAAGTTTLEEPPI